MLLAMSLCLIWNAFVAADFSRWLLTFHECVVQHAPRDDWDQRLGLGVDVVREIMQLQTHGSDEPRSFSSFNVIMHRHLALFLRLCLDHNLSNL
jgi:hypothetical protein